MKLLILADVNSAHTQKWVTALSAKGIEVGLFSLSTPRSGWFENVKGLELLFAPEKDSSGSYFGIRKLAGLLKEVISEFKPDLMHAHYASSYGLLGARTKFHPFVISAWGSDVMDFPNRSFVHKRILKGNLKAADLILSTSKALTLAIKNIVNVDVKEIPFGIDTAMFSPRKVEGTFPDDTIVFGTVKSLEPIYGIDLLIKAFAALQKKHPELPINLFIVGGGSKEEEYKKLAEEMGVADRTVFTGRVDFAKTPICQNRIDIFVNPSRNESFGVSVLEASSCARPVVATAVGGLKEVVLNGETGMLVPVEDVEALEAAMEQLALNEELRMKMGKKGREFVMKNFDLAGNVETTISYYQKLIQLANK